MKTFVQEGVTVPLLAPYDVLSGHGFLVGVLFAIAMCDALSGAKVEGKTVGVYDLPRTTGASTNWAPGVKLYWDDTAKTITKASASGANVLIGVSVTTVAVGDAVGRVRLNGTVA